MPASRSVDVFKGLIVEIEPKNEEQEVYFTDESPEFKMVVQNPTKYNFESGSAIRWVIAIGSGMPSPVYNEVQSIEVPPGEEREYEIGGELLAFEGHGVVGVSAGGAKGRGEPDYELRDRKARSYEAAYTFSVWDRSQYESLHERPRDLQKASIALSVAIVVFTIVQITILLFA